MVCRLTQSEIRRALAEEPVYHTDECRAHNPKGQVGGHNMKCPVPPKETITAFGGYHCICDWMDRIRAVLARMN